MHDAYRDDRFNPAGEHTHLTHTPHTHTSHTHTSHTHTSQPPLEHTPLSHTPHTHPCTLALTSRHEEWLRDALRAVRTHTQRSRRGDRRHPTHQQLGLYLLLTTYYLLPTAHYPLLR